MSSDIDIIKSTIAGNILNYLIDGNHEINRDSSIVLNALNEAAGQAFTSSVVRMRLTDAVFQLQRDAPFNGTLRARLYRASGTVGTNAIPDIAAGVLATSDPVIPADILTTWGLVNFHFPTPFTLEPEHGYAIVLWMTVYVAGQVEVGVDATSPMHLGNEADNTTGAWVAAAGTDCIFYLFNFLPDMLFPPGGILADVTDRWARQLGQIDLARYLGVACGPANPVDVQDTGLNTNPARWLHIYHWDCNEVNVVAAGVGGQQNLGAAVGAGLRRRIREITLRHTGTANTVVRVLISGGATKLTVDVPPQTTRIWSSEDGIAFAAAEQPACQTSDITGGNLFVSARGVEAAP